VDNLRHPSPRPSVLVDDVGRSVADPASSTRVGRPGPFGRERVLYALPLDPGPALLRPPTLIRDQNVGNVADPTPVFLGREAIWVSRMLSADWVEDTRRLG
jgi:hypothetical protein